MWAFWQFQSSDQTACQFLLKGKVQGFAFLMWLTGAALDRVHMLQSPSQRAHDTRLHSYLDTITVRARANSPAHSADNTHSPRGWTTDCRLQGVRPHTCHHTALPPSMRGPGSLELSRQCTVETRLKVLSSVVDVKVKSQRTPLPTRHWLCGSPASA